MFYQDINEFLRKNGNSSISGLADCKDNDKKFQTLIKDLICVIVFATLGLNKIQEEKNIEKWRFRQMYLSSPQEPFFAKKVASVQDEKLLIEESFLSSSHLDKDTIFSSPSEKEKFNLFQLVSGDSKDITTYSRYPNEQEALFAPGKHYRNVAYVNESETHFLVSKEIVGVLPSELDQEPNVSGDPVYLQQLEKHLASSNQFSLFESRNLKIAGAVALSAAFIGYGFYCSIKQ